MEPGIKADPGTKASGTLPRGTTHLKASEAVTLSGGSRTAATFTTGTEPDNIEMSSVLVSRTRGETDFGVLTLAPTAAPASSRFTAGSLVPTPILCPVVFALSVIGAYALNAALLDIWIVLIFGVIGFFARRHGFAVAPIAVAPIAVGLILGEMVETNLQNSLKMFEGQWWLIAAQPLAALFLVLAVLGLCGQ